jgi:hypothetical protein
MIDFLRKFRSAMQSTRGDTPQKPLAHALQP